VKDLEVESARLRRALSDLTLEKMILAEAADLGDPVPPYDDQHGPVDPQHAAVVRAVRARDWMGGAVPLGYRVENRALQVVETEAEFARMLFRRYLELGSVVRLKPALDVEEIVSPIRRMGANGASTHEPHMTLLVLLASRPGPCYSINAK
jgi:hypothetical protein